MRLFLITLIQFFILTGCSLDIAVLKPMGEIASQEKRLLLIAFFLMMTVIIPVFIMIGIFTWKYREKNTKADYQPNWSHSTLLEVIWWTIPIIIVVILGYLTWITTHKLDPYRPLDSNEKPIRIQVVALNWKWLFLYPEYNIASINFIQFPINVPVKFEITADAPMNSLAIPHLGGQIYAMQGMETKLHLIAEKPGEFPGYSANYSGAGFSGMKFIAKAGTKKEFEEWISSARKANSVLTSARYNKLAEPSQNNPVIYFSSVEKGLYKGIISKFMDHDSHLGHKHPSLVSPEITHPSRIPGKMPHEDNKDAVIYEQLPDKSHHNDFPTNVKAKKPNEKALDKSIKPDNSTGSERKGNKVTTEQSSPLDKHHH